MLRLVVTNWHVAGAVKQDVGRHQDWVVEEADGNLVAMKLLGFILKLRHPAHLAKPGEAVQDPGQLAVGWDAALAVQMNRLVI